MIKRLFEYLALSILAILGLAKLKGKRVNPLALRALLAILSFMALCLGSSIVLLVSGTWLLFLLAGDVAQKFGVDLNLFVPVSAEAGGEVLVSEPILEREESPAATSTPAKEHFLKNCFRRCKAYIHGNEG